MHNKITMHRVADAIITYWAPVYIVTLFAVGLIFFDGQIELGWMSPALGMARLAVWLMELYDVYRILFLMVIPSAAAMYIALEFYVPRRDEKRRADWLYIAGIIILAIDAAAGIILGFALSAENKMFDPGNGLPLYPTVICDVLMGLTIFCAYKKNQKLPKSKRKTPQGL